MANKIQWEKVSSVTGGGKAYFYTAITPQGRRWVVWDRLTESWHVTAEAVGGQQTLTEVKTPKAGMNFVEAQATGIGRHYPTPDESAEIVDLFHLARTAGKESRYDRMVWATNEFVKVHPEWTRVSAYKSLDEALQHPIVEGVGVSRTTSRKAKHKKSKQYNLTGTGLSSLR